jgi:hypothetical protein
MLKCILAGIVIFLCWFTLARSAEKPVEVLSRLDDVFHPDKAVIRRGEFAVGGDDREVQRNVLLFFRRPPFKLPGPSLRPLRRMDDVLIDRTFGYSWDRPRSIPHPKR